MLETLIVMFPLIGAIIAGMMTFGRNLEKETRLNIDRAAQWITCLGMLLSTLCSIIVFMDFINGSSSRTTELFTWLTSGTVEVSWALKVDTLTAVMMLVVTGVSTVVHVYSIGYMHHDTSIPRFMSYLSLFTFFMLMLITADNLLQLFFGWEGVGLASYLLIGFWYKKPSANAAAIKAFLVNRVGDFGFAIGIFGVFMIFDTIHLETIFTTVIDKKDVTINFLGFDLHAITVLCLLLFIGAMGKSAQLGLHTWLPDAMEGPTPVSALIHAATMVTAGVFMVARLSPLFEYSDLALTVITIIGASTAIFAATIACVQNDIKRVIAYSTCSQLGYMFFACGVSAYSAGIFHLMTHGFFKALLFLGAGSVIHAMSDEQDMRKMGGIWRMVPATYILMWIGSLALAGIWPFAGFYSKDIVLEAAWASQTIVGQYAFWTGILAAFLTAFYSWRLIFLTFHGTPRADEVTMGHVHESPKIMILPLLVLAIGAIFAGYIGYEHFVGYKNTNFWDNSIFILDQHSALEDAHHVSSWVKYLPLIVGLLGICLAYTFYIYKTDIPDHLKNAFYTFYKFLLNKWYFDELYDRVFVKPSFSFGHGFWNVIDDWIIDGLGPDGISETIKRTASKVTTLQTGYLYHYAFAMLIGVVLIITGYLFKSVG
ncbi:MAG: NADH-quinone oxidoreductase subunit L [Magnetovibrio sp.]|nr:NADH-quinone oxidoreductase subunit L [Magnetovibrio sp.]